MKKILASIMLASFVVSVAGAETTYNVVGGDRDSHGCIPSAGYVWSTSTNSCIRPWENATSSTNGGYSGDDKKPLPMKVCRNFVKDLKLGDGVRTGKMEDVKELQQHLKENGYLTATATGYFGPATMSALRNWQKSQGLPSTGFMGAMTRGKIKNMCNDMVNGNASSTAGVTNPGIPASCKVWYDGCNTCTRSEPGKEFACTRMACLQGGTAEWMAANKPTCREVFASSTQPVKGNYDMPVQSPASR